LNLLPPLIISQILDLHTNQPFKHFFKRLFQAYMAEQVAKQLAYLEPDFVRLDFATSIMKPLTLKWLLESWQHVKGLTAGCIHCYEKVGTLRALSDKRCQID
jgi:hypothetical protein